ncbi:hypothetical protein N7535_001381 [Penicillium sp. DV-2018c]|nr:hypothetical protein N7535_001381 [Penicillium sp. DV-2018c]
MSNASAMRLTKMEPSGRTRPTNTLVPVNDEERFNVPSAQRKILLPGSIWSLTKRECLRRPGHLSKTATLTNSNGLSTF